MIKVHTFTSYCSLAVTDTYPKYAGNYEVSQKRAASRISHLQHYMAVIAKLRAIRLENGNEYSLQNKHAVKTCV